MLELDCSYEVSFTTKVVAFMTQVRIGWRVVRLGGSFEAIDYYG